MGNMEKLRTSNHNIRVDFYEEFGGGKNWLKVSVEYTDKHQQPKRIYSDAWIDTTFLESQMMYVDGEAWAAEQVPKLTEKVMKTLYLEDRKGNVLHANN